MSPMGPNTLDTLASTLTREELITFWKECQKRLEDAYAYIETLEKENRILKGQTHGEVHKQEEDPQL